MDLDPTRGGGRLATVTGATGFVGWHLTRRLLDDGWRVRATVRPGRSHALPDGAEPAVLGSASDSLVTACRDAAVVFHVAGRTCGPHQDAFDQVNEGLTRAVAKAVGEAGVRLVYVSSQAAAGPGSRERPRSEDDVPEPCSPYGRSKLGGERAVEAVSGLVWTIVRPVAVYGPRDRGFLPLFRLAALGVLPIMGDPSTPYQLVHISDLVECCRRAAFADASRGRVYFAGPREPIGLDALLRAIASAAGRQARLIPVPGIALDVAARFGDLLSRRGSGLVFDRSKLLELRAGGFVCTTTRAADDLGWAPAIPLTEGLASTAQWYRDHGWI